MKPSRYSPRDTPTRDIIDNLVYVMNYCSQVVEHQSTGGERVSDLTFVANMNDWTMSHYSTDYCWQFMQCLQGRMFPVRVQTFLIVNPPPWFGSVWKMMKPMLSASFAQRVHMIDEKTELPQFFQPGFEQHLPDDFETGLAKTKELVSNFVRYQSLVEDYCGVYRSHRTLAAPTA
jgi:CRAL/TRIO domain